MTTFRDQQATITIDTLAWELFPGEGRPSRRYGDVLAELMDRLIDAEDDPKYDRVVFAPPLDHGFRVIETGNVAHSGVFTRVSAVNYRYEGLCPGSILTVKRNTLVVAADDDVAATWQEELSKAGYDITWRSIGSD